MIVKTAHFAAAYIKFYIILAVITEHLSIVLFSTHFYLYALNAC